MTIQEDAPSESLPSCPHTHTYMHSHICATLHIWIGITQTANIHNDFLKICYWHLIWSIVNIPDQEEHVFCTVEWGSFIILVIFSSSLELESSSMSLWFPICCIYFRNKCVTESNSNGRFCCSFSLMSLTSQNSTLQWEVHSIKITS